jgi:hypothetical protein
MGITLFTIEGLLGPLRQVMDWFAARPRNLHSPAKARPAGSQSAAAPRPCIRPRRPLRVVRVVEPSATASAGRMVISGRMAEVCAELERLAALEAG